MWVQRRLRELQGTKQDSAATDAANAKTPTTYPFRPIGTLQSAFSQRNGTPRQPLLVPLARARLELRCLAMPQLPRDAVVQVVLTAGTGSLA